MIEWLSNLLLKVQIKQVQKISIQPDEQLMIIFKTEEMEYNDLEKLKRIIERNLPEISGRVIMVVSPHEIDVKTVAINHYLQNLK